MPQTPFHAYYKARLLEQLPEAEQFIPVFASSDIEIYPFQIAAASFALRSPYQKGAVLCDEAGMGKSHEAMLVINQKWLEGCSRILLVIPNADLLHQWTEMLERFYTVPYVVLTNRDQWRQNTSEDNSNAFIQDAIVITTYDFAADKATRAERTVTLRHGEKMLFGANKEKGLVFENMKLKVVTVGQDGYTLDDVLTHDAHERDTTLHSMLAAMKYPDYPVALGVIREVEDDAVYDRAVERQVEEVKAASKIRCVDDLLRSGATWEVE